MKDEGRRMNMELKLHPSAFILSDLPLTPPLPRVQGRGVVFLLLCTFLKVSGGQLSTGRGR
jgi:hypothetical protein